MKHGHAKYCHEGCRCNICVNARARWKRKWQKDTRSEVRIGKRREQKERCDIKVCRGPRPSNNSNMPF